MPGLNITDQCITHLIKLAATCLPLALFRVRVKGKLFRETFDIKAITSLAAHVQRFSPLEEQNAG